MAITRSASRATAHMDTQQSKNLCVDNDDNDASSVHSSSDDETYTPESEYESSDSDETNAMTDDDGSTYHDNGDACESEDDDGDAFSGDDDDNDEDDDEDEYDAHDSDMDVDGVTPIVMIIGGDKGKTHKKAASKSIYSQRNPEYNDYLPNEKKFYKQLDEDAKRKIDELEVRIKEINENNCSIPRRFAILNSDIDEKSKAVMISRLDRLDRMSSTDTEYHKLSQWMEAIMRIPFGKYKSLPVNASSPREDIKTILEATKVNLDNRVYGHHDVKDHIVRILAQWISNPNGKGIVIGIHGPPGIGKTCLTKDGICNSLDLPFVFIPLGGMCDKTELVGSSYVYEGARWGKIIDSIMKCGYMNPVFFFDELDKVSETKHGEEVSHILMQLTDASQNDKFHDVYFSDFAFDLSRSIIIFSYNDETLINPILRDRMIKIETKGYKTNDKVCIAQKHLIPSILQDFNMPSDKIVFKDDILKMIIDVANEESGVRNMKRALHDIISNLHLQMLIGQIPDETVNVTQDHVRSFVYKNKHDMSLSHMMIYT